MFRMLSAVLLASPAGMGGGILCLLGLIWYFSPAPLPLALATLLAGGGLLFLVGYALCRDRILVQRGDSVTGHAVKVTRSIAKFSLTLSTPGPEIHPCRIHYRYTVDGIAYTGRSRLLWVPPVLPKDRRIRVYFDPPSPPVPPWIFRSFCSRAV